MSIKLIRYTIIYVGSVGVLMLLSMGLDMFASIQMPTGVSTVLPVLMAAMLEGQRHARETGAPFERRDVWLSAFAATGCVLIVSMVLVILFVVVLPNFLAVFSVLGPIGAAILVVISFVVILLTNRFGLGMAAKSELKAQANRKG